MQCGLEEYAEEGAKVSDKIHGETKNKIHMQCGLENMQKKGKKVSDTIHGETDVSSP